MPYVEGSQYQPNRVPGDTAWRTALPEGSRFSWSQKPGEYNVLL